MKKITRLCAMVCAFALLWGAAAVTVAPAPRISAAAEPEKLLTGNPIGGLFPAGTPTLATYAGYTWLTEGLNATDPVIVASDSAEAPRLTDGENGPDAAHSLVTAVSPGTTAAASLIFDLQAPYKVSTVRVWADSGLASLEVYASLDGKTYSRAGETVNTNSPLEGYAEVELAVKPVMFARYVKVIMHKSISASGMGIGEAAVFGNEAGSPALLSNNRLRATGPYNTSVNKLDTGATYTWITDQPFVTEADLIKTDNDSKNDGFGGWPDLTDGSSTETNADYAANSAWGAKGKYGAVLFDLKDMYQISSLDVWTKADSSKLMDGYEVLVSTDGVNFHSLGYTPNSNSKTANAIVNAPSSGVPGMNARYVKLLLHNDNTSQQLIVGEIAIWGWRLYDPALPKNTTPDRVEFRTELKNYSTLYLDWSGYNQTVNNVNKYAIYVETQNFSSTAGLTPKLTLEAGSIALAGKYASYFSLKPETDYYLAITPFHSSAGERKDVETVKVTTPGVLEGDKAGNIFAINDSPYGGGNYVNHGENEEQNLIQKLMLEREIGGIHKNRWWDHSSWMKSLYGSYGVAFHMYYHGSGYVPSDNALGAWTFSTYNEPDLAKRDPAAVAAAIGANHASMKAVDSRNLLVEPALGGVDAKSLPWLEALYNSDGQNGALVKTYFDVMDVHPYVKYEDTPLPGIDNGSPEMLIQKIADLRALMASHGDGEKPIVFTEIGWSTYSGGAYLKKVDRATQRNYLARAYLHSIAGGIKSVFWYSMQDDGLDPANLEHNLGLIDWNGKAKESYFGYYMMVRLMKEAQYLGPLQGAVHPYYGYRFWDESKNRYITALWDASWQTTSTSAKTALISAADTSVSLVGIDGSQKVVEASQGKASVTLTGAPVFIYSNAPISVDSVQ